MDEFNLKNPVFASRVALACCALHNVCERQQCAFEDSWLPDPSAYVDDSTLQHASTNTWICICCQRFTRKVYSPHPSSPKLNSIHINFFANSNVFNE